MKNISNILIFQMSTSTMITEILRSEMQKLGYSFPQYLTEFAKCRLITKYDHPQTRV